MISEFIPWVGGALLLTNIYTGVTSWSKGKDLNTLQHKVEKLKVENAVCLSNVTTHIASIEKQNQEILAYTLDLDAAELRWLSREPMVEYVDRWRTKYVDRNHTIVIKEEDCEDTIRILDAVRSTGF